VRHQNAKLLESSRKEVRVRKGKERLDYAVCRMFYMLELNLIESFKNL
jgi:hypothetical protein